MKVGFHVSSLTNDDSWLIEVAKVPQELRDDEPELMQTRWFDYRDLLPAQATYAFAEQYDIAYREAYARTRDYRDAGKIRPIVTLDISEGSDFLSFWRARQAADKIGCKYDFYLRFVMNRFLERGWKYLPRPNQLYGEELVMDIADAWVEVLRCSLQLAMQPRFGAGEYVEHPDQDAYHLFLVEQIKKREHRYMLIARLVFKEGVLPVAVASRFFSIDDLNRAKNF